MPFNYNAFKRITTDGIIDASLTAAKLSSLQITTQKIQANSISTANIQDSAVTNVKLSGTAITAAKLGTASVDVAGTKVTGSLPLTRGGTGLTSIGAAGTTLRVNAGATAYEFVKTDLISVQQFTGNGTWTKPAGITRIRIQIVGAGGGGSGHGEAGGAGGYAERMLDVTSITSVSVTVGTGGGGVNYHNIAGNGTTTSFGPYLTAGGGEGARAVGGHCGGRPGLGSGGSLSLYGGGGAGHINHGGGEGGSSYFGGSAIGVHANSPHTYDFEAEAAPGTGGTGGARDHGRGANGKGGFIIVWEYR